MDVDNELEKILNKISLEMYKSISLSQECCRTPTRAPQELYGENELEDILENCKVAIITFYSPTCPYCRAFEPIFSSVSREFEGKVAFVRVNVYRFPSIPRGLGIFSVPTTIFVVNRQVKRIIPGVIQEDILRNLVIESLEEAKCSANILN